MIKTIRAVAALTILSILLTACSSNLHECKIVDKKYEPGRVVPLPVYNGKTVVLIPTYVPEEYNLIIEGIDEEGNAHKFRRQVSPADYEKAVIGQEWKEGI